MLKRPNMQGMGGYPGMMNPKRPKLDRKFSDKTGFRVLLPSKMAGCLIGKGGSTINKLRETYDSSVRIPDCAGPERILEIISKDWDSAYDCLEAAIPYLYECPDGMDTGDPREMRFLIHQSTAGAIIGKGGANIKQIREDTGVSIKVYSSPCPQSTDRCVQVEGTLDQVIAAAKEVYKTVMDHSLSGNESIYDPENYDTFYANEYGGFGTGKGHGARPGGFSQPRGPPPMAMRNRGGPRGGGMGRGGGYPRAGYGNEFMDGPPQRGNFGMMGGPGMMGAPNLMDDEFNGGFGNGGFGRGGGGAYDNFGNGRGMPFHGPKLEWEEEEGSWKAHIEKDLGGAIIGIGGQRIRKIRSDSGATINIGNPENNARTITVTGDAEQMTKAKKMLQRAVNEFC